MGHEEIYPVWNLDLFMEMPERSQFLPLAPIGIGTAQVESLTGYVARLAEAHVLSVGDMIGREPLSRTCNGIPHRTARFEKTRPTGHVFHAGLSYVNGISSTAQTWAKAFERVTSVQGLDLLTLVPLRWTLSGMSLLKRYRAWCPQCYEEDLRKGLPYERLLWSLRTVTVCMTHKVTLEDRCQFCRRVSAPLTVHSQPGYCSACGGWLGIEKCANVGDVDSYELYVAGAAGNLLTGLNGKARLSGARFRRNLRVCIQRVASGNVVAFAELTQTPKTTLRGWLVGEMLPRLDVLMRFADHLGVSVRDLLMSRGLPDVDWTEIKSRSSLGNRNAKWYRSSESLLGLMRSALDDDECPSVPELAKRLGYKRTERLRQVDPDLCRRLTKRYRACRRTHWWRQPGAKRIAELDRIRVLLEQSLKQNPPMSVRHIAAQLGYAGGNGGFIHQSFPDLCKVIAKRLEEWKERRREEARLAVTAAIAEQCPPTLNEMSLRLGFQTSATLRSWAPDLADQLLKARADHAAAEKDRLRALLNCVLQENPAPSLNRVARRLQRSTSFLKEQHPDLCHAISSRYLGNTKTAVYGS